MLFQVSDDFRYGSKGVRGHPLVIFRAVFPSGKNERKMGFVGTNPMLAILLGVLNRGSEILRFLRVSLGFAKKETA